MDVHDQVLGLFETLPALDDPGERRALVSITGPSDLGIYLDWQGSRAEFAQRLLDELGCRGKAALSGFLGALPATPQLGSALEWQQKVAALRAQVDALDPAAFAAQFPLLTPAGGPAPRLAADPGMLAAALVTDVLAPYYSLGQDGLGQSAGEEAARAAAQIAQLVEPQFSGADAAIILSMFKAQPKQFAGPLTAGLKNRLEADPSLAAELATLHDAAIASPPEAAQESLAEISQKIGIVRGDVVGAVVGSDVLRGIALKVSQDVDTVEAGATLVGATIGATSRTKGISPPTRAEER